jgi:hypothetical protein
MSSSSFVTCWSVICARDGSIANTPGMLQRWSTHMLRQGVGTEWSRAGACPRCSWQGV